MKALIISLVGLYCVVGIVTRQTVNMSLGEFIDKHLKN